MSQQHQMNMAGMAGGPVGGGGAGAQQMNMGTPGGSGGAVNGLDAVKRLNTAIYDYLLRNQLHDTARLFVKQVEIETDIKKSPNQRQQPNGNMDDSMDVDSKEIKNLPDDLPAPAQLGDGPFLQDWWCQFWEIFQGNRGKGKPTMLNYVGAQRQAQKARTNMMSNMDPASMQNMRGYGNMVQGMNNGMGMTNDLKRQAMQNPRNMTQQQQVQMRNMMQQNAQMQANQMERQGSQMGMDGPRSGSPGSGDAPSPKRQRLEGNMPQMNQGRPGPPGQMQSSQVGPQSNFIPPSDPSALSAQTQELLRAKGIDPSQIPPQQLANLSMQPANHQAKAVETYSASMKQQMKAAMNQANSNLNKGMPPNAAAMGPAGAQGSPMSQAGMDASTGEFYAAAANGGRMPAMPNAAAAAAAAQQGPNGGNHALQDYQMQLMLLEQQNKKRLLMARQEQDSMAHPTGVVPGPNGQFPPGMSPSGSRGGDPSPNPNDMARGTPNMKKAGMSPNGDMPGRGSPQPGMMDPNMAPQLRQMMQNGQMNMRPPPSSHPMGNQMTPEQMALFASRQQQGMQMPNGAWQSGPQPGGPQMMPGQQPGQPQMGQPVPPNMTPKQPQPQGNMGPPAPPAQQGGTQPSSPAQAAAPPTPSQTNKPKPGKKGEQNKKANKKGGAQTGATPASEAEAQPPTPTPPTPMTPMHQNFSNHQQNKNMPNGQQPPNAPNQPQQNQSQPGANAVQQPAPDMGGPPFGNLDGPDQFGGMNLEFADLGGGDVLDNFDFDSFLNTGGDDGLSGFDANFAFGDSIEAGPDLGGN